MAPPAPAVRGQPANLLERIRAELRARHYSPRTERAYLGWIRRFVEFHGRRHPNHLAAPEVQAFLGDLVTERRASASTHQQALCAIAFLYQAVLKAPVPWVSDLIRPTRTRHLPVVLSREEARAILGHMEGVPRLMASLLYGAGLRLLECARLRIKDIDFSGHQILVHDGKGRKDRVTLLPEPLRQPLLEQIERAHARHALDLAAGAGFVELPDALRAKYPSAERDLAWQWLFPATRLYRDPQSGCLRRHHLHETVLQRAFKTALRASAIQSPRAATACAIHSPPSSSEPATTSGPSKNSSATTTSPPP
jgi:integron integrase